MKVKKGNKLILKVCKIAATILTAFLTFFTLASWSENAFQDYHDILNAALISIALTLLFEAITNEEGNQKVLKWWLFGDINFRQLCIYSAFWFFGVIIFPLESKLFPDWCHMVATGLAISGVYFLTVAWYRMWTKKWWIFTSMISLSTALLVSAFIFKEKVPWIVGHGEFAILATVLIFLGTLKKE